MKKFKKGLTIEYVLITMGVVAAFVVLLLTSAMKSTENASSYRDYIERKSYIDNIGLTYINNYGDSKLNDILKNSFSNNKYEFDWTYDSTTFMLLENREVILYIEFSKVDGEYVLTTYRYGLV